jgi:hypothetical protein
MNSRLSPAAEGSMSARRAEAAEEFERATH